MEVRGNKLYWAKVKPDAIIPTKEREDAGYDIYPCFGDDYMVIYPHETKLIPTGIACAVRDAYYLQVQERGSTGSKGLKYGAGVIDSGYRGEIFIAITNTNNQPVVIYKNEEDINDCKRMYGSDIILYSYNKAIAQVIVHEVMRMDEQEISYDELKNIPSKRGEGMLGSSGK